MSQEDNQQATPTEAEIAWLAGLIEGDGTLSLGAYARTEKTAPKISTSVCLYSTDPALIAKAVELVSRLGLGHYLTERAQRPLLKAGGEGAYHSPDPMLGIYVKNQQDALILLTRLRPWLFGAKAVRADLMLKYLARRLARIEAAGGNTRIPLTRDDLNTVREFYEITRQGRSPAVERVLND